MTNYQFREEIVSDDGDRVVFPLLVHELYSRPHSLEGVPEWASDEEIDHAVSLLEEKLGYDLLAATIRGRCRSIWLYGSFADPETPVDRDGEVSDLDLWVVHPDVGGDGVSTRFSADRHGLLCRLAAHGAVDVYAGDRDPDDLRGVQLPTHNEALRMTLERAERAVVRANRLDHELLRFRPVDLTIGTRSALDEFLDGDPALCLWPPCNRKTE